MSELLAELLSSRVRAAVLAHLLPRSHLGFSLTDLSRRLDLPISSLQHECYKLARLGLLTDERAGGARLYRPNRAWPLLAPLTALVAGAVGLDKALTGAVEGVSALECALLAGALPPVAGRDPLVLVLVGELTVDEVDGALARVADLVGPAVALTRLELAFFRPAEWQRRRLVADPFLIALLAGPCLVLTGNDPRSAGAVAPAGQPR